MALELDRMLEGLPEKITTTFYAAFSRFEYAMMQSHFLTVRPRAAPNWDKLAIALGEGFFQQAAPHVPTLVNDPPKKLIVRHGRPAFGPRPEPATSTSELLQYARRVRNNLFHGNKMFAANRQRDEHLIREVLWLIEFILEKDHDLRGAFHEPQTPF